jgi:hypothetical protein
MTATASAAQVDGFPGTFSWVQIVNGSQHTYTDTQNSSYTCPDSYGLDNAFPYPYASTDNSETNSFENNQISEMPLTTIASGKYNKYAYSFSATTTLYWQATASQTVQSPIQVALYTFHWGFGMQVNAAVAGGYVINNNESTYP